MNVFLVMYFVRWLVQITCYVISCLLCSLFISICYTPVFDRVTGVWASWHSNPLYTHTTTGVPATWNLTRFRHPAQHLVLSYKLHGCHQEVSDVCSFSGREIHCLNYLPAWVTCSEVSFPLPWVCGDFTVISYFGWDSSDHGEVIMTLGLNTALLSRQQLYSPLE